ncbi:MAG TPA: DUF1015 family protein [Bryobacteraceae bacterium]|jgi:uncharacterized protein (DUF1015 family)
MPALLPFRALFYPDIAANPFLYLPGEQTGPFVQARQIDELLAQGALWEDREAALFLYRQCFYFPGLQQEWTRTGVMGIPGDPSNIYVHEQVFEAGIEACREELGNAGACVSSLFLWCNDIEAALARLLKTEAAPLFEYVDTFGCRHQFWRMADPAWISAVQGALAGQPLFLADGHHRFAANWQLATIQIRGAALQTFAAHRLVLEARNMELPETQPLDDLQAYWEKTPPGMARFGVLLPELRGFELPCAADERNVSVLHRLVLRDAVVKPVRDVAQAANKVRNGDACMALLMEPLRIGDVEADALRGIRLPPKSTDFFPKLAAGMVMYRHSRQNELDGTRDR